MRRLGPKTLKVLLGRTYFSAKKCQLGNSYIPFVQIAMYMLSALHEAWTRFGTYVHKDHGSLLSPAPPCTWQWSRLWC